MSPLEDRLRDAYRAATQTVQPPDVPDLPAQFAAPQRPARARPGRSRALIPAAAAAAVTALAVTASLLAAGHGGPAAGGPAMPSFYVESPENGPLTVYDTATGAVASTIKLPKGMAFTGQIAYAGDARIFVAALVQNTGAQAAQHPPCVSQLYEFRLSSSGRPAPPSRPVATVPGFLSGASELAVSADGNTIAYASYDQGCYPSRGGSAEVVGAVDVSAGQSRSWTVPATSGVTSVALSADGQELAFEEMSAAPPTTRILATSAGDGPIDHYSRVVSRSGALVALSPDGQSLYLCDSPGSTRTGKAAYIVQSVLTGQRRVIGTWQNQPPPACEATLDASGRYLLISIPGQGARRLGHLVVDDLRTGQLMMLWPEGPKYGPPRTVGVAW